MTIVEVRTTHNNMTIIYMKNPALFPRGLRQCEFLLEPVFGARYFFKKYLVGNGRAIYHPDQISLACNYYNNSGTSDTPFCFPTDTQRHRNEHPPKNASCRPSLRQTPPPLVCLFLCSSISLHQRSRLRSVCLPSDRDPHHSTPESTRY